jgi:TonB family protein
MCNAMIKYLITSFIILSCSLAQGQETKLITKKFSGSKQISEKFYVLKSNHNIKQGDYISFFKVNDKLYNQIVTGSPAQNEFIKIKGYYNNGKKEGEWNEYSKPGIIYMNGEYHNDQKVGIWSTSMENGQVIKRFDYDINEELKPNISIKINYPESARINGIEGIVELTFHVNGDCTCHDINVTKSLSEDCDNEAIEAMKKMFSLQAKYWSDCEEKTDSITINFTLD